MSCKCSGVKFEQCSCKVVDETKTSQIVQRRGNDAHDGDFMVVTTPRHHPACGTLHKSIKLTTVNKSMLTCFIENLYEKCAAYNLRYCPLHVIGRKSTLSAAVKDLVIILCFIIANLVVFLTIFTRMTFHTCLFLFHSANHVTRYFKPDSVLNKNTCVKDGIQSR